MNQRVIISLVVVLMMASSAMAFDGVRKGFVLGGGLGFAPSCKADDGIYSADESGLAANIMIGFGWDEHNMLVYAGNGVVYSIGQTTISQGIDAIAWYHYWGQTGSTFFTVAGLGLYNYNVERGPDYNGKTGILLGIGYELTPHWQAGLYLSSGTTGIANVEIDHTNISLLIGGVAF